MASASDRAGAVVDRDGVVTFGARIGLGAAGAVYHAERNGQQLAAKIFDDAALAAQEARALRLAAPEWSPSLRGHGLTTDGRAFLLLDWVPGAPLVSQAAASTERLHRAWGVLHGVARCLEELHAAGIRHGDVKPANVLWHVPAAPADAPGHAFAVLVDLSLAQTHEGRLAGYTSGYAAPELAMHPGTLAADLYALGRTALEQLAENDAEPALRALLAALTHEQPGARPSAGYVAERARRALDLPVPDTERTARIARTVRAAYFAVRRTELLAGEELPPLTAWQKLQWVERVSGRALVSLPPAFQDDTALEEALLRGWPEAPLAPPAATGDWLACALDVTAHAATIEAAGAAAPAALRSALARLLLVRGELARARLVAASVPGAAVLQAEIARRLGDPDGALALLDEGDEARTVRARILWDRGEDSSELVAGLDTARAVEVRALCMFRRGELAAAARTCEQAITWMHEPLDRARLLGVRAMCLHASGDAERALRDFTEALRLATEQHALVEQATYATGAAAAASDVGRPDEALAAATQAALLWARAEQPARAARAQLTRSTTLLLLGASFEAHEAAALALAQAGLDDVARAYAEVALLEAAGLGAAAELPRARALHALLPTLGADVGVRVAARLTAWDLLGDDELAAWEQEAQRHSGPAQWDWYGHRGDAAALEARATVPAPADVRLFAYDRVVADLDPERAGPWTARKRELLARVSPHVPGAYRASFTARWGANPAPMGASFTQEQWLQTERLSRLLHGGSSVRKVGSQVLDALLLWTGAERGLLLVVGAGEGLEVQVARNVAREDLSVEQLTLSRSLAARALSSGEIVLAHDAQDPGSADATRSIHALRLRSILVIPLLVRGEAQGVLYLDDRSRAFAFRDFDPAWLRALAALAAHALDTAQERGRLERAVRRAERAEAELEKRVVAQQTELTDLRETLGRGPEHRALRGQSEGMAKLRHALSRVARSALPVLVRGESGTGKELVARALHDESERARFSFVSENCAALPENLLESTLFGHVKGAFTGASSSRVGLFERAHRGTLFLDEVGEMSLGLQAKLLRALESGEVHPVGSERARQVDVRVVTATHRDLEAMVRQGTFRQDLLFRIAVVELVVPPLRERREDIPLLVAHFLEKHGAGVKLGISHDALERLTAYAWPGNVRQLENEVRKLIVFSEGRIEETDLSEVIVAEGGASAGAPELESLTSPTLRGRRDALEVEMVVAALRQTAWNRSRAAEILGISRFGLQKMIRRLGLRPPSN